MVMITESNRHLRIGRDFVDTLKADTRPKCSGEIQVNKITYKWSSTFNIIETEHILYHAAKREGLRVRYLKSQAV
jgi:hypothetical protein